MSNCSVGPLYLSSAIFVFLTSLFFKCRVLKKMREEGILVAGAQPGRKGAGCYKVSQEEKTRIAEAAKAAAKKLKTQQKKGLGKVSWQEDD